MQTLECGPVETTQNANEEAEMNWLNINTDLKTRPEFIRSKPVDQATWFKLLLYCAVVENSGRISDCADWENEMWHLSAGVRANAVRRECRLWRWDGNDLLVAFYPTRQ